MHKYKYRHRHYYRLSYVAAVMAIVLSGCKKQKYRMHMDPISTVEKEDTTHRDKVMKLDEPSYPIGIDSIEEVIKSGFYADKTYHAWKLIKNGIPTFLIRPRQFGKTLFLDTIAKIAEGESSKPLFEKCFIGSTQAAYDWKRYPVIRLDFTEITSRSAEQLEQNIKKALYRIAKHYGVDNHMQNPGENDDLSSYYIDLVNCLVNLKSGYEPKVIVLIDAYDAPFIHAERNKKGKNEITKSVFDIIDDFLNVLKAQTRFCKLIFMTGITKINISTLGSESNMFNDISLHEDFADIAGYTKNDIEALFGDSFGSIRPKLERDSQEKFTDNEIMDKLIKYYNGYKFFKSNLPLEEITKKMIYNPISILHFFNNAAFGDYWYKSSSRGMLIKQIEQHLNLFDKEWETSTFTSPDIMISINGDKIDTFKKDIFPLMYQTGYLTLDTWDPMQKAYFLKFPNQEVRDALREDIVNEVIHKKMMELGKKHG